jgi:hypothetical protein
MLSTIFPFSEIPLIYLASTILICLLNGGLPQGSPISPMLTNLIMIPIDHAIAVALRHEGHYVYTRYADDLLISSQYSFDKQRVQGLVEDAIFRFQAPLVLNESKTRYGSRSGSNWNLGLMLNKDNEITVGHKKKKYLKAMLDNYMTTKRSGENWSLNDVQALRGLLSYYTMVEPLYTTHLLDAVSSKFGIDILGSIKADLSI